MVEARLNIFLGNAGGAERRTVAVAPAALPVACPIGWSAAEFSRMQNAAPGMEAAFVSEGDGTRTRNHRIDSPVL